MNKQTKFHILLNLFIAYLNIRISWVTDFIPLSIFCLVIAGLSFAAIYMMISQTIKQQCEERSDEHNN